MITMNLINQKKEEEIAVKAFKAKLAMARLNILRSPSVMVPAQQQGASQHVSGEFDITGLPLLVKKHIITAGIIQGDIFEYGDGHPCIKESQEKSDTSKTLHLKLQAADKAVYAKTITIVETLIDEVLEPQKKVVKRLVGKRSWRNMSENDFEIQSLKKPVISHLITKGIIKGDIYYSSGAAVSCRGSPFMADDLPQEVAERPIYFLIQGPNDKTVYWAVDKINKLIQEAEGLSVNDIPKAITEDRAQSRNTVTTAEVVDLTDEIILLPDLGETADDNVKRCVVLVQWLLAHPLLVSLNTCPPDNCEMNTCSNKMAIAALQCLLLCKRYECDHVTSAEMCSDCHGFWTKAQSAVLVCCNTVLSEGFDITKLTTVNKYVNSLATDPTKVGVLYDYPLPKDQYDLDRCRLFIDVAISCGLGISEPHIESYLRTTKQWYPVEAFNKIVVCSRVKPCPSNNKSAHKYPAYSACDHPGGLINFDLMTIKRATPERFISADAKQIPKCAYFPFLHRLSIFSNLGQWNISSTSTFQDSSQTSAASRQNALENWRSRPDSSYSPNITVVPQEKNKLPQSFTTYRGSIDKPNPNANPNRLLRKEIRKKNFMERKKQIEEEKKKEIALTMKQINDKYSKKLKTDLQRINAQELAKLSGTTTNLSSLQCSPNTNPYRLLRKEIRKKNFMERKKQIEEEKKNEIALTMKQINDKYSKKLNTDLQRINAQELAKLSGTTTNLSSLQCSPTPAMQALNPPTLQNALSSLQCSPTPAMQALKPPTLQNALSSLQCSASPAMQALKPPTLQNALSSLQMSIPSQKPFLFGAQPSEPGLPLPSKEWDEIKNQQLGQATSESDQLSDVISKLQEYIQETNAKRTDESPEENTLAEDESIKSQDMSKSDPSITLPLPSEQTTAANDDAQDSGFSSIIQQLEQYINSNSQISTQEGLENQTSTFDALTKPSEPDERNKKETRRDSEHIQKPSHLKRATDSTSDASQQKQQKLSSEQTPSSSKFGQVNKSSPAIGQQTAEKNNVSLDNQPDIVPEVSILGDSLLQRARPQFGGSQRNDCRQDLFTIETLLANVTSFLYKGGKLSRHCVVMIGANDAVKNTSQLVFTQQLKILLNLLNSKGHYVYLVTLPLIVSGVTAINKTIPQTNGHILSFQSRANLSVIPFHKKFIECENRRGLIRSIHTQGSNTSKYNTAVLSDAACKLIREMIEEDYKKG